MIIRGWNMEKVLANSCQLDIYWGLILCSAGDVHKMVGGGNADFVVVSYHFSGYIYIHTICIIYIYI